MKLKIGEKTDSARIYRCSACENLHAMLTGEAASPCEPCEEKGTKQHWLSTKYEVIIGTRNVRKEIEKRKTLSDKVSDHITDFCGSMTFVYLHAIWFAGWLLYNLYAERPFDPFPFGLLTLIVSLEAIVLATFILVSQNRQAEIADLRSELDYQIDLNSEKNTAELLAMVTQIHEKLECKGTDHDKGRA